MTIRNDATRQTLRLADKRRPRAVVARQGQVLLDADFDQQAAHVLGRIDSSDADMLAQSPGLPMAGRFAYPAGSQAFLITAAATSNLCGIGIGTGYLGGRQVENPAACTLTTQPHPRTETVPVRPYVMAIKSLMRHVDPVEDPVLADTALGDAQASGRLMVDWQVFPLALPAAGALTCASVATNPDWVKLTSASSGTLAVMPDAVPLASNPCSLTPSGGFSRLENLLYRIEVHGGIARADFPAADGPRFGLNGLKIKLSRRNASVMARVQSVNGAEVTVAPTMLDPLNWFATGLYAEIVSPHDDIDPRDATTAGELLFRITRATDSLVVLDVAAIPRLAALAGQPTWFLRLWDAFPDGTGVATAVAAGAQSQQIDLGDGLKALLGAGANAATTTFRRGDYWTFAARADGSIDWPAGAPFEVPHGPQTHYAPLQVLNLLSPLPGDEDCRIPFAALTDRSLFYRGGDGQAVPVPTAGGFATLPARLHVAVMRGRTPVPGALIRWQTPAGSPASQISGPNVAGNISATDAAGLAQVTWAIDSSQPLVAHQIVAVLLTNGNPEPQPVVFTAGFRAASLTSYQPGPCKLLSTTTNVQDALDKLCENIGGAQEPDTLQLVEITLIGPPGKTELIDKEVILNGLTVPHEAFLENITILTTAGPLESKFQPHDPIVEVELDIPYPATRDEKRFWMGTSQDPSGKPGIQSGFGYQRIRLEGKVEPADKGLVWIPSNGTRRFLETAQFHLFGQNPNVDLGEWEFEIQPLILCRLRIRSAHVWITNEKAKQRIYLNAEHLGTSQGPTGRELLLNDRDPQRAADLDMFFYLEVPKPG